MLWDRGHVVPAFAHQPQTAQSGPRSFDAGRAVREYLVAHHAFEECDVPGRLFRVVDQQHALVFHDGLAHVGPRGGYTEVRAT